MLAMPIAGDDGPTGTGQIALVGIMLIAAGLGTFAFEVSRGLSGLPFYTTGLAIMGMGMGCSMIPVRGGSANLAPHQILAVRR